MNHPKRITLANAIGRSEYPKTQEETCTGSRGASPHNRSRP